MSETQQTMRYGESEQVRSEVNLTPFLDPVLVAFFLGNDRAPGDLPSPSDPGITLLELPAFLAAVLQYSGNNTAADRARVRDKLLATLRDAARWCPTTACTGRSTTSRSRFPSSSATKRRWPCGSVDQPALMLAGTRQTVPDRDGNCP